GRALAAMRAPARLEGGEQRLVLRHAAEGTAHGEGHQRVGADAAEGRLAGRVARGAAGGEDQIERADGRAMEVERNGHPSRELHIPGQPLGVEFGFEYGFAVAAKKKLFFFCGSPDQLYRWDRGTAQSRNLPRQPALRFRP